jgi:hypothetical protein
LLFRFATYGNAFLLDNAQSQEKKVPTDPLPDDPLKVFWWKSAPGRGMREAAQLVREMPCLKAERSQELTASVGRE